MPTLQPFPLGAFVVESAFLGDTAAFALGDGSIRLAAGVAAAPVKVHSGAILAATRTLDGKGLVTGGDDGRVAFTDAGGKVELVGEMPRKWVDNVAAGPGGAIAYAAGRQAVVRFADGRTRSFDHPRAVAGLAFAPKGLRLAVARYDGVTLWWPGTEVAPVMLEWKGAHIAVTLSPDGRFVVTAMQENALHGWRIEDGKDMRMSGYPAKPRSLSWSAKGRFLATSGANAAIVWPFQSKDGPMGRPPLEVAARQQTATRVACHPREDMVAIGYSDGMVIVARIPDGAEALLRSSGDGPVSALAWNEAGTRLAFGTEEGAAGIADLTEA
jgi:WD40 repeat protein